MNDDRKTRRGFLSACAGAVATLTAMAAGFMSGGGQRRPADFRPRRRAGVSEAEREQIIIADFYEGCRKGQGRGRLGHTNASGQVVGWCFPLLTKSISADRPPQYMLARVFQPIDSSLSISSLPPSAVAWHHVLDRIASPEQLKMKCGDGLKVVLFMREAGFKG